MSSTHQHNAELFVLMLLQRLSLGSNPLRRGVDRLEAVLLMLTVAAALLVIPASAALSTTLRQH